MPFRRLEILRCCLLAGESSCGVQRSRCPSLQVGIRCRLQPGPRKSFGPGVHAGLQRASTPLVRPRPWPVVSSGGGGWWHCCRACREPWAKGAAAAPTALSDFPFRGLWEGLWEGSVGEPRPLRQVEANVVSFGARPQTERVLRNLELRGLWCSERRLLCFAVLPSSAASFDLQVLPKTSARRACPGPRRWLETQICTLS